MILKFLGISFISFIVANVCLAVPNHGAHQKFGTHFLTPRDIASPQSWSNVKLKNLGSTPKTIYGIYIRQMAYVTPGQSCASATVMYDATDNAAAGSVVMPVTMAAHGGTPIGKNYLYNMIYGANYYALVTLHSPPGCALPGCTWGSDSITYDWCIYLGALAPVAVTAGYSANVPPAASDVSGAGFNYNVSGDYAYIGPVSCNDITLTCSVATPQSQSFS